MNIKRNAVGWFEIYVQDMERARGFYQKTFQATLERLEAPGAEFWAFPMQSDNAGCAGALVKMEGKDSGVGGTIVIFVRGLCGGGVARGSEWGTNPQREDVHRPVWLHCPHPRY